MIAPWIWFILSTLMVGINAAGVRNNWLEGDYFFLFVDLILMFWMFLIAKGSMELIVLGKQFEEEDVDF